MTADALIGPHVVTFGCKLNAYESEVMKTHARAAGLTDAVIVNTCAVTAEAERQARQAIRRLRRERPNARIVVTGCAAQIDPARFAAMPEVDRVIGNAEKMEAATWNDAAPERLSVGDIALVTETAHHLLPEADLAANFADRARAFVEVQQGCDHRCTFCIIPQGRGPSRSVPVGGVVDRVRALVAAGYREVVLTGVDLTGYGTDLPGKPALGALVRRLLTLVPELERLRLSSLDPVEVDDELIDLFGREARLMPHVHLSVQAGDDGVLKRMARRHRRGDVIDLAMRLRVARPGIALGADLIAGFPGESDEAFANTLALVDEAGLSHLHVFPYSARPGTPAARWKPVPGPVVRERAARLRAKGEAALDAYAATRLGAVASVLIEKDGMGHSEHYLSVRFAAEAAPGAVVAMRITGCEGGTLRAEVAA